MASAPRTRSSTAKSHPGTPDIPNAKRPAGVVEADKKLALKKQQTAAATRASSQKRVADLELKLRAEQEEEKKNATHPNLLEIAKALVEQGKLIDKREKRAKLTYAEAASSRAPLPKALAAKRKSVPVEQEYDPMEVDASESGKELVMSHFSSG